MMLIVMCVVCLGNFLEFPVVQGEKNVDDIEAIFPENPTHVGNAYLPPQEEELVNVKNKKPRKKRQEKGRQVSVSFEDYEKMAKAPFETLSTKDPTNQKIIVEAHNKYRMNAKPSACNMLKLLWSTEAAVTAANWANKCVEGHSPSSMRKIPNYECGENLYLSEFKVPWPTVVDAWQSEGADFTYGSGAKKDGLVVGHYTTLMCAASNKVGCAVAECPNNVNKYIYVCHTCPIIKKSDLNSPYKSGSPCGDCANSCENNLCTNPCQYQDHYNNCESFKTGATCGSDEGLKKDCPAMCLCTNGQIK